MDDVSAEIRPASPPATALREADGRVSAPAPQAAAPQQASVQPPPPRRSRKLFRYMLFALGAAVLLIGGLWYYLSGGRYVTTSDADVQANVLTVSTDVSGIVEQIPVHEGEAVTKGQVLFHLDPDKFQITLDNARADLAQTELTLRSLQADYLGARRQVAAEAALVQADQATFDRYAALVKQRGVTQQQFDDAKYKLAADQATVGAGDAQATAALARLGGRADIPITQMPAYKHAAARFAETQREFDHSIVRAPFNGVVTELNKLQLGQYPTRLSRNQQA